MFDMKENLCLLIPYIYIEVFVQQNVMMFHPHLQQAWNGM